MPESFPIITGPSRGKTLDLRREATAPRRPGSPDKPFFVSEGFVPNRPPFPKRNARTMAEACQRAETRNTKLLEQRIVAFREARGLLPLPPGLKALGG